jgi:hypothetical protein
MKYFLFLIIIILFACQNDNKLEFFGQLNEQEKIKGKQEYKDSPFLSAGNRLYIVGHQNGTFPDLGWHIKDEMGGVWLPPIKLLDGFHAEILKNEKKRCLNSSCKCNL